jgi:hypothetical protein
MEYKLCNIIPKSEGNAVDSSSRADMSKNHKIRNSYSSHVPNRASTVPPTVAGSEETTSLGFTKKSGDVRPYTAGTKQSYRAYCGVYGGGGGSYKGPKEGDSK